MITQNQRTNQRAAAKAYYSSSIGVESSTSTVVESKTRLTFHDKQQNSLPMHCNGLSKVLCLRGSAKETLTNELVLMHYSIVLKNRCQFVSYVRLVLCIAMNVVCV